MGSLSCLSHFITGFYESQVGGFTGFLPPMVRVPQVLLNATPPKPKKALLIGMIKGIMVVDNPLIGSDSLKGKALEGGWAP